MSDSSKTFLVLIIIVLIGGSSIILYSVHNSATNFSVEITEFFASNRFLGQDLGYTEFLAFVEVKHRGNLECKVFDGEFIFDVNGYIVTTDADFEYSWESFQSETKEYLVDFYGIEDMAEYRTFAVQLIFRAKTRVFFYETYIEKRFSGKWN